MAGQGNISFIVETPHITRSDDADPGPGTLPEAILAIMDLAGLTTGDNLSFDVVLSDSGIASEACHQVATILYQLEFCCVVSDAGPSEGDVPTVQVPTLLDQFEPILDSYQIVPVEEDDHIFMRDIRCYAPVADIPLEDLAAVSIGVDDDQADPGPPVNPVALEGVPDPFEGYDRVDVRYPELLSRDGLPGAQCSLDPGADPDAQGYSQLLVDIPNMTSDEDSARLADTLRLRSKVERPVKFWTAPKWLKLNINDIVTINTYHGQLKVRIINITIGADWVLEFDSVTCNRLAHYPFEFFATTEQWPVPTLEQMETGLEYGIDGSYSNGSGGVWDSIRFAPPGQLPPGVDPIDQGG